MSKLTPLQFATLMQRELDANNKKGPWQEWTPSDYLILADLHNHVVKLGSAVRGAYPEQITEHGADVANLCMKIVELFGKISVIAQPTIWLCFHCGFETSDHTEAAAHFGDCDDAKEFTPICNWWKNLSPEDKVHTLQNSIIQYNESQEELRQARSEIETLECQLNAATNAIGSRFKGCTVINEIFNLYDSMEGRALAAEEKLEGLESQLRIERDIYRKEHKI